MNDRDYHALTAAYNVSNVARIDGELVTVRMGAVVSACARRAIRTRRAVVLRLSLRCGERAGLDDREDLYHALTIRAQLARPGATLCISASLDSAEPAARNPHARESELLERRRKANPKIVDPPQWIERLVLAADAFVVARTVDGVPGSTVIAGYHWFGDWGRDTMIALPGLALATGRPEITRSILQTFAPGTKTRHTPLPCSTCIGCAPICQPLKSPTTQAALALGAHTANSTPS